MKSLVSIQYIVAILLFASTINCRVVAGEKIPDSQYKSPQAKSDSTSYNYSFKKLNSSSHLETILLTKEKINEIKINLFHHITTGVLIFKIVFWIEALIIFLLILYALWKKSKFTAVARFGKKLLPIYIIQALFVISIVLAPVSIIQSTWLQLMKENSSILLELLFYAGSAALLLNCILIITIFFPGRSKIRNAIPWFLFASILSAIAELTVFFIIVQSFFAHISILYLSYNILCFLSISLYCKSFVQKGLLGITNGLVLNQRMKLLKKIFSVKYQQFEKLNNGRVYTTLNNDTEAIGNGVLAIISLIGASIGISGGLILLFLISVGGTLAVLGVISVLGLLYFTMAENANKVYEEARATESVFMSLLEGLTKGFKELSLHQNKKSEYAQELEAVTEKLNQQKNLAFAKYINASVLGEGAIVFVIAAVSLSFPVLFKQMNIEVLIAFILLLIYMMEPIGEVLEVMPGLGKIKVSWKSIQSLYNEIPEVTQSDYLIKADTIPCINKSFEVVGMSFNYSPSDQNNFNIGPISFSATPGEVIFITGGNGSGKTTLAKLITGLYVFDSGSLKIDGIQQNPDLIGEYYSAVFSDYYLFDKLYTINLQGKDEEIKKYLQLLELQDKVKIVGSRFNTTDLSSGQRKRLALLKCYLEDRPVFLFDEWAADQDPEYKKFFYHTLLKRMKEKGKIVLAITHDDSYFYVADQLLVMHEGKINNNVAVNEYSAIN